MAPNNDHHHHRSTTKSVQKPFKARHATKSTIKERSKGKVERFERGVRRTPHQHTMSKLERKNQAKQKRLSHHQELSKAASIFTGRDAVHRLVALIPLSDDIVLDNVISSLKKSLDVEHDVMVDSSNPLHLLSVERFKQKLAFIRVGQSLLDMLDACKLADFVVFIASAQEEMLPETELLLKAIESQGISNVFAGIQHLQRVDQPKKRVQITSSLKSFLGRFFPNIEKITSLESNQECLNMIRSLCATTPKGIHWREDRSWMIVEDIRWPLGKQALSEDATGEVVLTGTIRGKALNADRLVQVGDWGSFQIQQVTLAKPIVASQQVDSMSEENDTVVLAAPSVEQDDLLDLAPEEVVMQDGDDVGASIITTSRKGVLLDDHHYFSDADEFETPRPKRLPKGTSEYQAAWYLDDVSDSDSDFEIADVDEQDDAPMEGGPVRPADGFEGLAGPEATEIGGTEYAASEMFLDPSPNDEAEELEAYRASRKNKDAEEDLEFPDEIELEPNVLARERLARYRGLKSSKTSPWDVSEDLPFEPPDWKRLLTISNYKAAKNRVLQDSSSSSVKPGSRVHVHLRNVPLSLQRSALSAQQIMGMFSLLKHEQKRVAANYSITLSSDLEEPLKSKQEIIMQIGPRRFTINPLFSQAGNTPNDVHRFERWLHPGRTAVATSIAPLTWGSVPVLYFVRTGAGLEMVGSGTSLPPSPSRVVAKRIVLTGHPYKIHRKLVTVRYMFFNSEDIQYFKSLPLWTKRGRSGFIRESLGTHGYFKAVFDGKINPLDAIGVSLWKRCWPGHAIAWKARDDEKASENDALNDEQMLTAPM